MGNKAVLWKKNIKHLLVIKYASYIQPFDPQSLLFFLSPQHWLEPNKSISKQMKCKCQSVGSLLL